MDPITSQLSPSRGPPSSPEKLSTVPRPDSQFVFSAKANLASVHSSDARLLDTTNIVAQASLPSFLSPPFSSILSRGWQEGMQPTKIRHTNRRQMTMENRLPRDRILQNSNDNFLRIHSREEFPTNGNKID